MYKYKTPNQSKIDEKNNVDDFVPPSGPNKKNNNNNSDKNKKQTFNLFLIFQKQYIIKSIYFNGTTI